MAYQQGIQGNGTLTPLRSSNRVLPNTISNYIQIYPIIILLTKVEEVCSVRLRGDL